MENQKDIFATPMMQQYKKLKEEYNDCILFFRLGDFYEMFMEDAKIGADVLSITLTKRDRGRDGKIPMAGIPYHAVDSYLSKLVKNGYKVAICEQVGDYDEQTKLVGREVVRIVTPGTLLDEKSLQSNKNNYVATVVIKKDRIAFAFADVSTGDFRSSEFGINGTNRLENMQIIIGDQFSRFSPSECLLSEDDYNNPKILKIVNSSGDLNVFTFSQWDYYRKNFEKNLLEHFKIASLETFGQKESTEAFEASSILLGYLKETQKNKVSHIKRLNFYKNFDSAEIGRSTIFNLELFETIREGSKKGSLISVLDKTSTSMGGRKLRNWMSHPLVSKSKIDERLDCVETFVQKRQLRMNVRERLSEVYDVERILSRLTVGIGNARDVVSLKDSLNTFKEISKFLDKENGVIVKNFTQGVDEKIENIIKLIEKSIVEDPPIDLKGGGLIRKGVSYELDSLKEKVSGSQKWIAELEGKERASTGISTLKVGFNKVFGYYIEVSKANASNAPKHYVRKQTLVNCERYITQELKEKEEIVLEAQENINNLEYGLFLQVVEKILETTEQIQDLANATAELDCVLSFAHSAQQNSYVRPHVKNEGNIKIVEGRHPVVEKVLEEREFVPNDVELNHTDQQLIILTGPNMAGKSVFIRQTALIVIMAQMGSFVPASSAEVSIADKIFVRSGASDFITSGLSTFMVEMVETAQILNNATQKSLIILDEIGRGTTTYDGVSIAWAVSEFLVKNKKPFAKTLFATHYHELQELENECELVKNYQVLVSEEGENTVFLHKVVKGKASHSYGIAVAELAGVPKQVTQRAKEILGKLEGADFEDWLKGKEESSSKLSIRIKEDGTKKVQDSLFSEKQKFSEEDARMLRKLKNADINKMTPLEALNFLNEIK